MSLSAAKRESRRERVLHAARRLFAERGVERARMEEIAAAAGYTRRTLYAHFKSRDEICMLVYLEDVARRWDLQKEAMAAKGTGIDKIRAWGETLFAFAKENPQALRLEIYWDFAGLDRSRFGEDVFDRFERQNDELADGLRRIFREGVDDGSIRSDLPMDQTISQFLYSFRSVIHRALSPSYSFTPIDPDAYVRSYMDLFHRGIRQPGGEAE